ncbi:MAG: PAS domain S-box protein [Candidatus Obscuribacterales bacterium]|nr:PAS domain S-box protein [Candidatus Obscuribacterales bacterium]
MKPEKSSPAFIAGAAAGIGLLGSALLTACSFALTDKSALPIMAFVPAITALATACFVYKKAVAPLKKSCAESRDLAKSYLPGKNKSEHSASDESGDQFTALNQTIEELGLQVRETRKKEKSVIENAADVICVIDIDSKILQVNAASKSVWGYTPEEITGRNLSDYLLEEYLDNTLKNVLGAEKSIDRIFFENRFRKKSGEIIDLLWSAHWSVSDGGLFCVAHDITERKRSEELLRESEERSRRILEHLPAGVAVLNNSGLLEFVNEPGRRLVGLLGKELRGMHSSEIFAFCREPFSPKALEELINNNSSSFDAQITRENGERFPAEVSLSRIQIGGEKCFLVIFLDVTSKHAIEMAKREFVTMVSHDLRTPLTSILSILSYLDAGHGGSLSEKGATLTSRAKKESERLISLIADLLDLEKMKAGKFSMHFAATDAREIAKSAQEAAARFAEIHKVKLALMLPDSELKCFCDGARIIQVLVNLIDNAIKFSPPEEQVVVSAEEKGEEIRISVANKGRGIPEEKLGSIFERFEQVEEADAKVKKGSGLGLAICKTIVEQHHGKISVSSNAKEGTKFTFSLPAKAFESSADNN